ncbi:MAG: hypothetical protein WCA46_10330 [Actinocatenispora sp.]
MTSPEPGVRPALRDSRPVQSRNRSVVILAVVIGALMVAACLAGAIVAAGVTK